MRQTVFLIISILLCVAVCACSSNANETPFTGFHYTAASGNGKKARQYGISGIAYAGDGNYLGAVDLKSKGKQRKLPRFLLFKHRKTSRPRPILKDFVIAGEKKKRKRPTDLEGLTPIPGKPGEFIALESRGCMLHLKWNNHMNAGEGTLRRVGRLAHCEGWFKKRPAHDGAQQCEALALHPAGNRLLLVWATRGDAQSPATIAWSRVAYDELVRPEKECKADSARKFRGTITTFRASALEERTANHIRGRGDADFLRHVSDLAVDAGGKLYATAAFDPGNDGPFAAGIFQVGGFTFPSGGAAPRFRKKIHSLEIRGPMARPCYKYEALTFSPNGGHFVLGSDDENFGGCLRFHPTGPNRAD